MKGIKMVVPMDKHPDITLRRTDRFLKHDLEPDLFGPSFECVVETTDEPMTNAVDADKVAWKKIEPGYEWGPAYTTRWFRIRGTVPDQYKGQTVLAPAVCEEATVWSGDSAIAGIDWAHPSFPLSSDVADFEYVIEGYARNPQHSIFGKEPPREPLVEKVMPSLIRVVDAKLKQLYWDVEYGNLLVKAMDIGDPSYHTMLRALNEVVNTYRRGDAKTIKACRQILETAFSDLHGEAAHTIWPVGHSHLDTAWLWPVEITKQKMVHTSSIQLGLMERYPEFTFVHSQASQYEWVEKKHPKLFKRIKDAVKRGQWDVTGSMWVECDCNVPSGESFIRQILYGKRYFREKFGEETKDLWLPDVFGYSAALPQILRKFNIEAFLTQKISWNQSNKFPHNTFMWQGIDGSQIWSHFPPADTYIGNCEPGEILRSVKNHKDHGRSDESLYLYGWGDGGGGVTERHIEFLRRGRKANNLPVLMEKKRAKDFFATAPKESKDLAVWVGELYLEFHRGTYTTQAANKKNNRECEFLLRDAELLSCFAPHFPASYPASALENNWKKVLLNQFHDILPGTSVNEVYRVSDAEYAEVKAEVGQIVESNLRAITVMVDTSKMNYPVALFHNSAVSAQVSMPWDQDFVPQSVITDGEAVPCQLVDDFGEQRVIFTTPQAALSNVAVADFSEKSVPVLHRLKTGNRKIENNFLAVRFDNHGNITSLRSLEDGYEVGPQNELLNVFQLFEDKPLFWSAWDVDPYIFETGRDLLKSESFEIVERGPVRMAAELTKTFGSSRIRQRISVGDSPGVRFDTWVDWHEEDKMLKVAFPLNLNVSRATYEIQCGYLDRPTHRNTSWDAAMFEVCAQKWVDMSEGNRGVTLINDCKHGHDVKGSLLRLSLLRAPKAPDPMADMGTHRFSYLLMPHYGPFQLAGITHHAMAFNTPLRHAKLEKHEGENATLPGLISVDNDNLVIQSIKRSEAGDAIIVRLYECHNTRGTAELNCVRPVVSAALCDLEEENDVELDLVKGSVQFAFKPFEIITIKLRV